MSEAYLSPVDVLLILRHRDMVLLALREGTGYADGMWNLPSGKLEERERLVEALLREAREEIGIVLALHEVRTVASVQYLNEHGQTRVGFFFEAKANPHRQGQPYNAEPDKCARINWFPFDALPRTTVPYTLAGIELYLRGVPFGVCGW